MISSIRTNIAKHDFEQDTDEEVEQDEENVVISDLVGEQEIDDEPGQTMMVNSGTEQEEEEPMAVPVPVHHAQDGCKEDHQKILDEHRRKRRQDLRGKARSIFHLMDHYEYNPECLGCQAKARNKKHYKHSFQKEKDEYDNVLTMDQVTMVDMDGTTGIGGFRYALVVCKNRKASGISSHYVPLHRLRPTERLRNSVRQCQWT